MIQEVAMPGMFGMRAKDDSKERGRLRELRREEIRTARLQVRCEHDRSVVAVVRDDCIVIVERVRRNAHDQEISALFVAVIFGRRTPRLTGGAGRRPSAR